MLLSVLQAVLGFVLLFNIDFNAVYIPMTGLKISGYGGVTPFNGSRFEGYSESWLQATVLLNFGSSYGHPLDWKLPGLTPLGSYPSADCAGQANGCLQLYLTQIIPNIVDDVSTPNQRSDYLKLFHTPFYHIILNQAPTNVDFQFAHECRGYGYVGKTSIICAKNVTNEQNQTSILLGQNFYHSLQS